MPTDTPQPDPIEPKWRVISTDAEIVSGVAPVCPSPAILGRASQHWNGKILDLLGVWDCCPGPHLQCVNERDAETLTFVLNNMEVEICS